MQLNDPYLAAMWAVATITVATFKEIYNNIQHKQSPLNIFTTYVV